MGWFIRCESSDISISLLAVNQITFPGNHRPEVRTFGEAVDDEIPWRDGGGGLDHVRAGASQGPQRAAETSRGLGTGAWSWRDHTCCVLSFFCSQVLEEEAVEFTLGVWRQVIFESMAYGEGLLTEKTLVD